MFPFFGVRRTDVTLSLHRDYSALLRKTREISQQSHPLNGEHIPLKDRHIPVFRRQTHWRNPVSPPRLLSPDEINPLDFSTISPVERRTYSSKGQTCFRFRRQTDWRNLVLPPRLLSPAEMNRWPRQRAFGRLSSDALKILWTYIGSKSVYRTIILWHMPLRVRSYVACPIHRKFLKFYQLCHSL